jgi:hypothetical protein
MICQTPVKSIGALTMNILIFKEKSLLSKDFGIVILPDLGGNFNEIIDLFTDQFHGNSI